MRPITGAEMSVSKRLNWLQRLFGTAMGFASFGIGGLLFATTVVPWVWLTQRHPATRAIRLRKAISRAFRLHVNMLRAFGVLDYRLHNGDRLENSRIVIANHPTLLDVVFLVGFIENAVCVVKDSLFQTLFVGFVIRTAGYISNADPHTMIDDCTKALDANASLVVFPEGTRSVPGTEARLQRGAAYIAMQSGQPMTPVRISCVPSSLTKAEKWYQIPPSMMQFDFVVDEPLNIAQHMDKPRALGGRSVNQQIRRVLFKRPPMETQHVSA